MMTHTKENHYDLIVLGGGSGGVRAARKSAETGKKVLLVEESAMGGTCVQRGCVPKKLLVYASEFSNAFADMVGYGWHIEGTPTFSLEKMVQRKNKELERLAKIYETNAKKAGVEIVYGRGTFSDSHTITVENKPYTGDKILIAVGGRPFLPPIEGIELGMTSTEILAMETVPSRLVVIGGGYIASEFASLFRSLGAQVHMLIREDEFMLGFDDDVRTHLKEAMKHRGIHIHTHTTFEKIEKQDNHYTVYTQEGTFEAEGLLVATGRIPYTKGLGLETAGIKTHKNGAVIVDNYSQTNLSHVYAVGDVTNRLNLTPVAIREAEAFVKTAFKGEPTTFTYDLIPSAVFTQPSISYVGLSEEQARQQYPHIKVYTTLFRPMKNVLANREEKSFMKMIVEAETEKVLGVHIMDPIAGEIVQGVAIALKAGATKKHFDETVGIHPTTAEELTTLRD